VIEHIALLSAEEKVAFLDTGRERFRVPSTDCDFWSSLVGIPDGDTLKVLVGDQKLLRIRLAFCDAPEKKQAFGTRAKQAMSELVFGKDIDLRLHAIDRYGRAVGQVAVDGKDVGAEMLRQGLAWVYERCINEASTEFRTLIRNLRKRPKRTNGFVE
jgi:endonuclease YncB( thermonuclease family)